VVVPRGASMKLSQAVGDIRLTDLRGSIEALTQVGAIRATDVSGQVTLSANVGGIDYVAPTGLSAKIQAKANLGAIQSDLPLEVTKPRGPGMGSSAFGTIGGGEDNISLKTNTGSIRIRSAGEPGREEPRAGGQGGGAPSGRRGAGWGDNVPGQVEPGSGPGGGAPGRPESHREVF
jgi:hypothetical protein